MSKTDDGGQAFPVPMTEQGHIPNGTWNQTYEPSAEGMTLLDYFAGQAIEAARREIIARENDLNKDFVLTHAGIKDIAECSYKIAEAMIAEKRRLDK